MQVSRKSYKAMLNVGICVWSHWFLGFKDQVQQGASTGSCILLIANHSSPEQAIPPLTWAPRSAVLPFPAAAWSGGWDSRETWPKRATFALGPWTKTQQQPYWKFLQEQLYVGWFSTVGTSSWICPESQIFQCSQFIASLRICNIGDAILRHGQKPWVEPRPAVSALLTHGHHEGPHSSPNNSIFKPLSCKCKCSRLL